MSTMASTYGFEDAAPSRKRLASVALIFALHGVMFWAAAHGLLSKAVSAVVPETVMVTFVSSPSKPVQPEAPKPVKLTPPPPSVFVPVPVIQLAQAENAITIPQQAPAAIVERTAAAPVPAPAAAVGVPTQPKLVTTGVEYIKQPQVVYSPISRRMGEQGKVVLRVLVNDRGQPERVLVESSSGFPRLDESGRQAALRALFKPYMENGRPVTVEVLVPLNFQLG
jgi:protein TonB